MPYNKMNQANQTNCDRIAATLLSGALFVGASGISIEVMGIQSLGNEWEKGLPECEILFQSNCVVSPALILENGLEERA